MTIRLVQFLLVVFLLVEANSGFAVKPCEVVGDIYRELRRKAYCPGGCLHHVETIIRILSQMRIPLHKAKVLVLTEQSGNMLRPYKSHFRDLPEAGWQYHVVLEFEGKIYDMSAKRASPLEQREYFERLWRGSNVEICSVEANDYLDDPPPVPASRAAGDRTDSDLEEWQGNRRNYQDWLNRNSLQEIPKDEFIKQ